MTNQTAFRALPAYTLQQLSHRAWQISRDGKPIIIGIEEECREYLNKWARGQFKTLPRKVI